MRLLWLGVGVLTSVAWGAAGSVGAGFQMLSYGDVGGWRALHSWCDTPGRVLALTLPAKDASVVPQKVTLAQWVGSKAFLQPMQLGPQDAGAGQLYTALNLPGKEVLFPPPFFVHSSNVENVIDPSYRMTRMNEYRVPSGSFTCRYAPQAAVLAATAEHSVIVWEHAGRVTYASRNRDGTPGVNLSGGTHTRLPDGSHRYLWRVNAYQYELSLGVTPRPGGALTVRRGGKIVNTFPLLAYSLSLPRE